MVIHPPSFFFFSPLPPAQVIFGVLTVMNMDQAEERANSDLPESWGQAALNMAMHNRKDLVVKDASDFVIKK